MTDRLAWAAERLVRRLSQTEQRIVFAESCTGGLVASQMAGIAGVSAWLCGSAVTYRCDTKVRWLGVSEEDIEQQTAVCEAVARQMAVGVLNQTPEAMLAASITGHLGPQAPDGFDGVVFVGLAKRSSELPHAEVWRHQLTTSQRRARQEEAATIVLDRVYQSLA